MLINHEFDICFENIHFYTRFYGALVILIVPVEKLRQWRSFKC